MPWYKAGTVSVVQNSNAVTGAGTAFIANSRVGDAFLGPDGGWYEVTNIASNTAMAISPNYLGASIIDGAYAIAPIQGYVKDSADALRALVVQFGSTLAVLGASGTLRDVRAALELSDTDGLPEGRANKYFTEARVRDSPLSGLSDDDATNVGPGDLLITAIGKLQAQLTERASAIGNLQADVAGRALSGGNSDITSLSGLTTALSVAQGGTGAKNPADACLGFGAVQRGALNGTAGTYFMSGGPPAIAHISSSGNDRNTPAIFSNASNGAASAVISFLREGASGVHLGLDTDNQFKVGGWSMGPHAYRIYHEGNTTRAADGTLKAI
jgi:hypothetical protein